MNIETRIALDNVANRLQQMRLLWNQAQSAYFDPNAFKVYVQNSITLSRTVTFILQSNKKAIPGFDSWYDLIQAEFSRDPILVWAKNARNKIEKQGDLNIASQLKAEIVAAYFGNPATAWTLQDKFTTIEQLRKSIPDRFLDDHVKKHGVLCIERRWVDVELPDREVLDALAHVYGRFVAALRSLSEQEWFSIGHAPKQFINIISEDTLDDGRLRSMVWSDESRAVFVSIKDGSIIGYRNDIRRLTPDDVKKVVRRYGKSFSWPKIQQGASFSALASALFEMARRVMLRDHYHQSMIFLFKQERIMDIVGISPNTRSDKYLLMREIARQAVKNGADAVIHISEAWTASQDEVPDSGFAVDAPNRGEALVLMGANSDGETVYLSAKVRRRLVMRTRVRDIGPTERDTGGAVLSLAPFLNVWGRLDVLRRNGNSDKSLRPE